MSPIVCILLETNTNYLIFFRAEITFRKATKDSKTIPENAEQLIAEFRATFNNVIEETVFRVIANMDETFLQMDSMHNRTFDYKGIGQVNVKSSRGNSKLGCTVVLCCTIDGRKAPALVVIKAAQEGPLVRRLREEAPDNVMVSFHLALYLL